MSDGGYRHVARRARTAAGLPGRVVAVEDRCSDLERHVAAQIDAMRAELVELRKLLESVASSQADLGGLVASLLGGVEGRLDELELGSRDGDQDGGR